MRSQAPGAGTSEVEVTNIGTHGVWVYVKGREYFLDYREYPWFRDARVRDVIDVQLLHGFHLHWPALDVDLEVASLDSPGERPLVAGQKTRRRTR